jgi:MFS family permease
MRLGYKKLLFTCFITLTASFFALSFVRSYQLFIVMSFILGLASGIYIPCAIPLLTAVIDKQYWGRVISFHETAAGCALVSIPFITTAALHYMQWHSFFLVMGGLCLIMAILLLIYSPDPRSQGAKTALSMDLLRRKNFWLLLLVFITCGIAAMGIYNIIPLFLVKERGLPITTANTLFGISRLGGFGAMILVGFILDRFNVKKIFIVIVLMAGLSTMAIALITQSAVLVIVLVIQATFSVVFFPVGLLVISKITNQRERGLFTGVAISAAGVIGPGLSPIILGAVADAHSFTMGIMGVGIITTISGLCLKWLDDSINH